jgi:hypothetical protein
MRKNIPSIFEKIPKKERYNLLQAIKGKKYWNISERNHEYVYVVSLSRARISAPSGYYANTSAFGRVQVIPNAAKYCRKYRVLLINLRLKIAYSTLTWMSFTTIIKKHSGLIEDLVQEEKIPPYINNRILHHLISRNSDS